MKYSKWIVAFVILMNVVFSAVVLLTFYRTGSEPTTLTVSWFAFTTGELWALAMIKRRETQPDKEE